MTKGAFRFGRRVVAMDGTCEDVADDPHNANYFGRINSGPTQSPFPQLRALYLEECGTHAIFDAVPAPCRVAEARLAPVRLGSITAEMLVLLDRGLFADPLIEGLRAAWRLADFFFPSSLQGVTGKTNLLGGIVREEAQ